MTYTDTLVQRISAILAGQPTPTTALAINVGITDYSLLLAVADLANQLRHALVRHFDAANLPTSITIIEAELYPLLCDFEERRTSLDPFDADARIIAAG